MKEDSRRKLFQTELIMQRPQGWKKMGWKIKSQFSIHQRYLKKFTFKIYLVILINMDSHCTGTLSEGVH